MTAIIMVAGVGSRLKKRGRHLPKCLLAFGGETILSRNVRLLRQHGVTRIVVVAGYQAPLVREDLDEGVIRVFNPFFRVTNSLASLWFAHQQVDLHDDLVIFNGDVIYEEEVLARVLAAPEDATLLIDTSVIELADYRLMTQGGCVVNQGKDLSDLQTDGEYVGVAALRKSIVPPYLRQVRDLIEQRERYDMWWEEALFEMRDNLKIALHVADVSGLFWAEADFIEDVERIEQWFRSGSAAPALLPSTMAGAER